MIITFAGHSSVSSPQKVKKIVKEQIQSSIVGAELVTCYIGGYGDFDDICACACRELKQKYGNIEIIYVTPYMNSSQMAKIKDMQRFGLCDGSTYPPIEKVPLRFAIAKRNEWMIKESDLVIAYVNREYGGAYKSFRVAKRKGKKIINICDLLSKDV